MNNMNKKLEVDVLQKTTFFSLPYPIVVERFDFNQMIDFLNDPLISLLLYHEQRYPHEHVLH